MKPASSTLWHIVDPSAVLVRHWPGEDEHVVFHAASGDIHLLNPAAAAILGRLLLGPTDLKELCRTVDAQGPETVDAALESLDRLGLICPLLS